MVAWRAETGFVGVACGIMDQYASALSREGEALHLECDTIRYDFAPFRDTLLIFDTAIPRSLRTSHYNERRAECDEALRLLRERWPELPTLAAAEPEQVLSGELPPVLEDRALHVSRETRRVRDAVASLRAGGSISRELLVGSHESLRDLYECSRPELDWVVSRAITMRRGAWRAADGSGLGRLRDRHRRGGRAAVPRHRCSRASTSASSGSPLASGSRPPRSGHGWSPST